MHVANYYYYYHRNLALFCTLGEPSVIMHRLIFFS